jgi:hypothetical protein
MRQINRFPRMVVAGRAHMHGKVGCVFAHVRRQRLLTEIGICPSVFKIVAASA